MQYLRMKRYLYDQILRDLAKKMVFVTGPRQVGKTYLSKQIMSEFSNPQYLNYDNINDRKIINEMTWLKNADLLVFDEIHKKKDWKNYLKGVFDTRMSNQAILVTGSARLETFRQSGDSLAGRYYHYRLNPISVKELQHKAEAYDSVELLNKLGGFPEPLLNNFELTPEETISEASRWKNQYYTDLVREDIIEFSRINEINSMKTLLELLRSRVGSPLSYKSIAEDLQVSPNTIKKYISILESLYIIFLVRPYHKNIARAILKEPKVYFYDSSFIKGDDGIRLENTSALCLLKHAQYLHDSMGEDYSLNYLRTKDRKEIDFVLVKDGKPYKFIEIKTADKQLSGSLKYFSARFPDVESIQLVHNLYREEERGNIKILILSDWLARLSA